MPIIGPSSEGWRGASIDTPAAGEERPRLSVVIPAYNEARRLPATLTRLDQYLAGRDYRYEIIVVSNGSTDGTDEVVRAAAARMPSLRLIVAPGKGKGLASRVGALQSLGEVVFLCDADLSMPPHLLESFLASTADADVVIGSREALGARRFNEPWYRHLMGRVFNYLVRLIAVRGISDTQAGFKAFRRAAADALFSLQTINGWGFDVELLFLARRLGLRVAELPIDWHFDSDTRVRPGVDTLSMMSEVLMIRLRDIAGRYRGGAASRQGEDDRAR